MLQNSEYVIVNLGDRLVFKIRQIDYLTNSSVSFSTCQV